jgi:hydroxyacylglutathione hydrolase
MSDHLQIWPAHGAGSACGKALGAIPSTTLGYEKLVNPAFQIDGEDGFVRWLLDGQPEAPWYFARMKHVNKVGPALLHDLATPQRLDGAALDAALAGGALVIDVRPREAYAAAGVPGTLSVPATTTMFNMYVGWFVDYGKPTYLVVEDAADLPRLLRSLRAIGVDDVPGFFVASEVLPGRAAPLPTLTVEELGEQLDLGAARVLDVRGKTEYEARHIPGAQHIPLGHLLRRLDEVPAGRLLVTQCASGYRSHIAASALRRAGREDVASLVDGAGRWQELAAEAVA